MINFLNKFIFKSKNFNYINLSFQKLKKETEVKKIFEAIDNFSEDSEIRYVGGCVRKIINKEIVDDIDLAVNLNPNEVCDLLKKNNIKFFQTGLKHGTITAVINEEKFEITSLRKDIFTDGRHAKVEFSKDWNEDAKRRDFSINAIYADIDGNLFDPYNGKKDLEEGGVIFVGDAEKRIKEDYLRVLRYIRFFLNYSKKKHSTKVIKIIKKNLSGISKISSERLLDEFKKLSKSNNFLKLLNDKFCVEMIQLIFPQFKNINILKKISKKNIYDLDFIILLSLIIIDESDNVNYFLYKFNLSNKDKKRILFLKNFSSQSTNKKTFSKKSLGKILYYNEKQFLLDLLSYKKIKSQKDSKLYLELINFFKNQKKPVFPIKTSSLMEKFNLSEGKELGLKLKKIEEHWVNNGFKISSEEVNKLMRN
jgi:tRNA nucleotidyltransferase/poly(A) polymerase